MGKHKWGAALAMAAMLAPVATQAEVISITGEFPATWREASFLRTLHIGRIDGQDGQALSMAVERALGGLSTFDLIGGRAGRDTAEGEMSGVVTTGVQQTPYTRKEKQCVAKDANGKCEKEQEVEVKCWRRVINLTADLRIVRNADGRIVYTKTHPFRDETSWCQGSNPYRTTEEAVSGAIRDIAANIRSEIAPTTQSYRIRLRESNKGMSKDMAKLFKTSIKASQRDMATACGDWAAMDRDLPNNPSLTYNLGLCAEQRGDYMAALSYYQLAQRSGAKEGGEGADRAQKLIAGKQDAAERSRLRKRK